MEGRRAGSLRLEQEMNSLLEKRHGLAFVAALVSLAAVGFFSYRSTRGLIEAQDQVNHALEVIDRLDELVAQATQAESATRGYILSGEPQYMASFRAASSRIEVMLGELEQLPDENPSPAERCPVSNPCSTRNWPRQARTIERARRRARRRHRRPSWPAAAMSHGPDPRPWRAYEGRRAQPAAAAHRPRAE